MATDRTRLVLLGTAGGPLPSPARSGICSAVVVSGRTYVVDCGGGATRQLRRARLLGGLHRVLLTHLHSDHTCDYFNLFLLGWPIVQWNPPVHVFGPGSAGGAAALPPDDAGRRVSMHNPANPTPGLADLTEAQFQAHAYDINIRMRESGRHDLRALLVAHELTIPAGVAASSPSQVAPDMDPFVVEEDDDVRITATLVAHAPVFPAFAYRFDTATGSVVFSGDTAPCPNLVRLARGAGTLVHEVYDDTPAEAEADAGPASEDETWEAQTWEAQRRHHHMVTSHTPLSAVGGVAAEAGVDRLVLTHFIPGDDVLADEYWLKGVTGFAGEVVVGADLMELAL